MSRTKTSKSPTALANGMKSSKRASEVKSQKPEVSAKTGPPAASAALTPEQARVKWHLRCPVCWEHPEYRGKGIETGRMQVNGPLNKIYYKCDTCGTTFQNEVRTEPDDKGRTRITIDSAVEYEVTPQGLAAENQVKEQTDGKTGTFQPAAESGGTGDAA